MCHITHTSVRKRPHEQNDKLVTPKRKAKDSYGCVSWQLAVRENVEELEPVKEQMKSLSLAQIV